MINRKEMLLVVAIILLPFFANILKAESLDEIKKYFELRDTISIVNLEMKRALQSSSRSPLLTKANGTENLKRLILFLEHRIQQFSQIKTPLKYHYVRKLGEDFKKSRELFTAVATKIRGSKLPGSSLNSPVTLESNYKLEPRPFFKPIDVRTILSPALAKSLKYTDKELARISKEKAQELDKNAAAHKALKKNDNKASSLVEQNKEQKVEASKKTAAERKAIHDEKVETALVIETRKSGKDEPGPVVANKVINQDKRVIEGSLKNPTQQVSTSTVVVIPPPYVDGDIKTIATATNKVIAVATPSAIIKPGKGEDIRVVKKSSMRPLAIMVENHNKARPQTGLEEAEIVYEIPVEGGITRFMPIFFHIPGVVGPVRSCREYFVDRALEVKALYIHCGGSPKGYAYLSKSKINSIDEIRHSKPYYRYKGRRAPHNLYTKGKKILSYMKSKIKMKLPEQRLPLRYGKSNFASDKSVKVLSIRYHGNYKVKYAYNSKGKYYERFMNRVRHIDKDSKKPIHAGTIIVQTATMKTVDKVGRQEISFIGKGPIKVLQEGKIISGTWSKKTPRSYTNFIDAEGKNIIFPNKHPIWIQVVSPSHKVLLDPKPEPKKTKSTKKKKKKSSKKKASKKKTIKKAASKLDNKKLQKQTSSKLNGKNDPKQAVAKSANKEGTK